MPIRTGIFFCECGPNISKRLDMEAVMNRVRSLPDVVTTEVLAFACTGGGLDAIRTAIQNQRLNRVVVAACSPKEHERTFRPAVEEAGLNRTFLAMANIREQCAWTTRDPEQAVEKAVGLIRAAVRRVRESKPLPVRHMEVFPDVLVVGAGVAGIQAALSLAGPGRRVHLVEQEPFIGGKVAEYEEIFPDLECGSCLISPILDRVLHHPRIQVMTMSRLTRLLGSFGQFIAHGVEQPRYVDPEACLGCGACALACPVTDPASSKRRAVGVPREGCLPHASVLNPDLCLRFQGQDCVLCREACPVGAIDLQARDRAWRLEVGAVVLATGFETFDPLKAPQFGYGLGAEVHTAAEFERLISSQGPFGGEIKTRTGRKPKKLALVSCVGSRTPNHRDYCSEVCCGVLLKFALTMAKKLPEADILWLFSERCLTGSRAYLRLREAEHLERIRFIRTQSPEAVHIEFSFPGLIIEYIDGSRRLSRENADFIVLAPAFEGPGDASFWNEELGLELGPGNFFNVGLDFSEPTATSLEGVWAAGCAAGPKNAAASAAQGQAAAAEIQRRLVPGEVVEIEMGVRIRDELCSGCGLCLASCPYSALTLHRTSGIAGINDLLCRGCGLCEASCPSGAVEVREFDVSALKSEIAGLIEAVPGRGR